MNPPCSCHESINELNIPKLSSEPGCKQSFLQGLLSGLTHFWSQPLVAIQGIAVFVLPHWPHPSALEAGALVGRSNVVIKRTVGYYCVPGCKSYESMLSDKSSSFHFFPIDQQM